MTVRLSVKLDVDQARRSLKGLERQVEKAAARAINRTADGVKTNAVREVSRRTKIKQKDVRQRIKVWGATAKRLIAEVGAFPYSPNLFAFRATQNKRGVAASAWERRKTYKGAFILKGRRVVSRVGKERFPLKGLRGPSVPGTFASREVTEALLKVARQRWQSEFKRELARRISMGDAG